MLDRKSGADLEATKEAAWRLVGQRQRWELARTASERDGDELRLDATAGALACSYAYACVLVSAG
jgi:hypothetical protein